MALKFETCGFSSLTRSCCRALGAMLLCLVMSANLALASTAPGIISTVSAIAPATGSPTGGTAVTLTGTGFTGATGVTFRGVAATNLVVVSPTSITATTPAGAVGGASVLVTTPGGVNAANSIFAYAAPALVTAQAVATSTLTANVAVTPFKPVTASGGLGALSYAVSPALPTGLSIASATGLISGTPTVLLAASTFTVTVSDSSPTPQTSFKTFSLAVNAPALTTVQAVPTTNGTAGTLLPSFAPVSASGGLGALSYAVSPALPTGLSIASATGLISGTPTVLLAASTFTVTVSDSSQTPQTSFKTFALTIAIPPAPTVASIVPPLALHSVAPLWRSQALASRGPHVLRSVG